MELQVLASTMNQSEIVTSLSEEFNISKSTIYQWVRRNNKKQKNNKIVFVNPKLYHILIENCAT